ALKRRIEGTPIFGNRKFHIDGWRTSIGVFDLGIGKRGLARPAPVYGLESAVNESALVKFAIDANNGGLVRMAHRRVRIAPIPENAQAFEALPLYLQEFFRVFAALLAELNRLCILHPRTCVFLDLQLDGQPVAIPARDIR